MKTAKLPPCVLEQREKGMTFCDHHLSVGGATEPHCNPSLTFLFITMSVFSNNKHQGSAGRTSTQQQQTKRQFVLFPALHISSSTCVDGGLSPSLALNSSSSALVLIRARTAQLTNRSGWACVVLLPNRNPAEQADSSGPSC
jgi:hypothetical protein